MEGFSVPNLLKNSEYEKAFYSMDGVRNTLLKYRYKKALLTDNKILTSWNALLIAALAKASVMTGNKKYLDSAVAAFGFIDKRLKDADGKLFLRICDGETKFDGQLDDYAFLGWAAIELYEATFDVNYLKKADEICEMAYSLFGDNAGGLYFYSESSEQLIRRPKEYYDGAMPSGNSVAAYAFYKLSRLTGQTKWIERSRKQFEVLTTQSEHYPGAHAFAMFAMSDALYPSYELICTTDNGSVPKCIRDLQKIAAVKNISILVKNNKNAEMLGDIAQFTKDYPIGDKTLYYLCKNGSCARPTDNIEDICLKLKLGREFCV
ncbi:MAG: thioredoxin domain-containing protein [Clostridia bacterium]|nr:thioredoxin domain-containing protein [Clostridia bacterium]